MKRYLLAILTLLLLPALVMGDSGVSTRVYPTVIMRGSSIWLTCRVTPDERNRKLIYGIVGTGQEDTERQLDGYSARITWGPVEIKRVPCDAGPAYCRVERNDGTRSQDTKPLLVGGCEP